ncbi:hypothetical protein B6N60_02781 [Richelia sinica FACHB-800]|uniref:Uncharacterized protein n=1 Tax=Richelia sinica FACHB-800 TaxID=1357546 RepID=A0A975T8C1_9NOST|nr:hypothetical protein [Richelia sinica]MBD2665393.1 hypothetical protein [Richelia sinica FACHB-800]QXE24078.1 hypothetical protein B6N60_02781 [Richelia sinica FACHB-800]
MSKEKQKPLLYILPIESVTLQDTVSSAITNVASFDEDNKLTYYKIAKKMTRIGVALLADLIIPLPLGVITTLVLGDILNIKRESNNEDKNQNKESKRDVVYTNQQKNDLTADISKVIKELNLEDWSAFLGEIPYSSIPEDFEFSPGHPLPGRFYRAHPLESKNKKYIPIETFDSLLYAEREAELIRLLVDLGATKITIQEKQLGKTTSDTTANAAITGTGGVKAELKRDINELNESTRTFSLGGINWTPELQSRFNEEAYSWLPYEPAWAAVVHARLYGKCLTASIELTNDNSYSISGKMGLTEGLLQNLGGFDMGASFTLSQTKTSLISVEFSPSIAKIKE